MSFDVANIASVVFIVAFKTLVVILTTVETSLLNFRSRRSITISPSTFSALRPKLIKML